MANAIVDNDKVESKCEVSLGQEVSETEKKDLFSDFLVKFKREYPWLEQCRQIDNDDCISVHADTNLLLDYNHLPTDFSFFCREFS